jgi:hypothetical protein
VSKFDDERPSEDVLSEIVFGNELDIPIDVEEVGPWTQAEDGGEFRELKFSPLYVHPWGLGAAGLIGRQSRSGRVTYGIRVNVDDDLSTGEAALLRAALGDLIENVERINPPD